MCKLEVTKEKVIEAAKQCPQAEATLKTLFPEAFKKRIEICANSIKIDGWHAVIFNGVEDGKNIQLFTHEFDFVVNRISSSYSELIITPKY